MRRSILPTTPAEFELEEEEWDGDLSEMAKQVAKNSNHRLWLHDEFEYKKQIKDDSDPYNKKSFAYKAAMAEYFYGIDLKSGEKFNPSYLQVDDKGNFIDRAFTESDPYHIIQKGQVAHKNLKYINDHPGTTQNEINRKGYVLYGFCSKYSTNRHSYFALQPANRLYASGLVTFESKFYGLFRKKDHVLPPIPRFIRRYTITDKGKGVLDIFKKTEKKAVILT